MRVRCLPINLIFTVDSIIVFMLIVGIIVVVYDGVGHDVNVSADGRRHTAHRDNRCLFVEYVARIISDGNSEDNLDLNPPEIQISNVDNKLFIDYITTSCIQQKVT